MKKYDEDRVKASGDLLNNCVCEAKGERLFQSSNGASTETGMQESSPQTEILSEVLSVLFKLISLNCFSVLKIISTLESHGSEDCNRHLIRHCNTEILNYRR